LVAVVVAAQVVGFMMAVAFLALELVVVEVEEKYPEMAALAGAYTVPLDKMQAYLLLVGQQVAEPLGLLLREPVLPVETLEQLVGQVAKQLGLAVFMVVEQVVPQVILLLV